MGPRSGHALRGRRAPDVSPSGSLGTGCGAADIRIHLNGVEARRQSGQLRPLRDSPTEPDGGDGGLVRNGDRAWPRESSKAAPIRSTAQDGVIGTVNLIPLAINKIEGNHLPYIPSSDWARNKFLVQSDQQYSTGKLLGGTGLVTLATAGLGGSRRAGLVRRRPRPVQSLCRPKAGWRWQRPGRPSPRRRPQRSAAWPSAPSARPCRCRWGALEGMRRMEE